MSKRIALIDNNINSYNEIKILTKNMSPAWEVVHYTDPSRALVDLDRNPADMILLSMEMDSVNSERIARHAARSHPSVARLTYFDRENMDAAHKARSISHRTFTRPFNPSGFLLDLKRSFALRTLLCRKELVDAISRVEELPSLPEVYRELKREMESEDSSIQRIADIVSRDVAISAEVLRHANSSWFRRSGDSLSIHRAISLLGLESLKAIVLHERISRYYLMRKNRYLPLDRFNRHSGMVARVARRIARAEGASVAVMEESFTAGLLHDIGKLVLLTIGNFYKEAVALKKEKGITFCEAERELLGTTHAEIGGFLLNQWDFSDPIVEAISYVYNPRDLAPERFSPLLAVHIANELIREKKCGTNLIDEELALYAGMQTSRTDWDEILEEELSQAPSL